MGVQTAHAPGHDGAAPRKPYQLNDVGDAEPVGLPDVLAAFHEALIALEPGDRHEPSAHSTAGREQGPEHPPQTPSDWKVLAAEAPQAPHWPFQKTFCRVGEPISYRADTRQRLAGGRLEELRGHARRVTETRNVTGPAPSVPLPRSLPRRTLLSCLLGLPTGRTKDSPRICSLCLAQPGV